MAVSTTLSYADVAHLYLDPMNPRLGRHWMSWETPQDKLLGIMRELVLSLLVGEALAALRLLHFSLAVDKNGDFVQGLCPSPSL